MNQIQKSKLKVLIWGLLILGIVVALVVYALRQNISLYYTPLQISQKKAPLERMVRAGGMVVKNSIERSQTSLEVKFAITDYAQTLQVTYRGILPDLFREGQGVVIKGYVRSPSQFEAIEVLAKHDEKYMPPEVQQSLQGRAS